MARGRPSRTHTWASPVTVRKKDGTVSIQPALSKKALDRFLERSDHNEGPSDNRPVNRVPPCACGSTSFWDNRRFKAVGKFPPAAPDFRCVDCRQGRWIS